MTNATATTAFTMGPLPRTDFTSEQDRANTYAAALQNQQIVVPAPNQTGSLKKTVTTFALDASIGSKDTGLDLTSANLVLSTTGITPTIGILAVGTLSGAGKPGVVFFTGDTPDTTYTLTVTQYSN
jgi:hypothetical protein